MIDFHLPAETAIGYAHLQVSDLARSLEFYSVLLGFRELERENKTVTLSADSRTPHLRLTEIAGARPKPRGTTGLYHVAIRLPSRLELARVFQRFVAHRYPFQGFSDHAVSEALYLADPDGNGLELYRDRPRDRWQHQGKQVVMVTEPLDTDKLLADADDEPWVGIHPGTDIGHVHLHVSDLGKAEAFYSGLLGLDVMGDWRAYGALFLAAGGYHHHLGTNVWAGKGAPPPPPNAVGLRAFSLRIPGQAALEQVVSRLQSAGVVVEQQDDTLLARDADQNSIVLESIPPA